MEDSKVMVAHEPDSGGLPVGAQQLGLKYFLEVSIARQFLEDSAGNLGAQSTLHEKCARLIQYAINDA